MDRTSIVSACPARHRLLPLRLQPLLAVLLLAGVPGVLPAAAEMAVPDEGPPRERTGAAFQPQYRPTLTVRRAPGPIQIDGELEDPGWQGAARADGFTEVSPGDQVAPPVASQARVTYDDTHLYVALIAHDDPAAVRVSLRDRDNIFSDDYFGIMFDTYGDLAKGYELFVNPLGIQGDFRVLANGDEDIAFDMVWESEGRLTPFGYQVEIAIPFDSLRFPRTPEQTWRVNFWRDHQREVRRRYAWAAQDRDDPCDMCQWGTLTGIQNIEPGSDIELIGSLLGSQAGELASSSDPESGFENDALDGDAALNVRYSLSSAAAAELAVNPDFSQIESDAGQIDVNNTFALFFTEKRPFFQEGSDLYRTWVDAIYTRSINDPDLAAKLSGQFGRLSMVYTLAQDRSSPLILPFEERSEFLSLGRSTSNLVRARQTLFDDSYVGALFTDRRLDGGGAGTVVGIDSAVRVFRNYLLEMQVAASRTVEPSDTTLTDGLNDRLFDQGKHTVAFDGETYWGRAIYLSVERDARVWNANFDYWEFSPTFRTDNGFTTRNDYREASLWLGPFYRPNGDWLINWEPSIGVGRIWRDAGGFEDEWIRPNLYLRLRGQTDAWVEYLISRERFAGEMFPGIRVISLGADSRFSETFGGGVSTSIGQQIFRDFDAPEMGDQLRLSADATIKPLDRLTLEPSWTYSRMDSRERDERLFAGHIFRTRVHLNFTRHWFLRFVVQHNTFNDRFDIEPLLTYQVNPFTVFYIGSNSRFQHYDQGDFEDPARAEWRLSSRQFFTKLQYLFRF